ALWVASNGMIAVARTLNAAYCLTETRTWWERRLWAMALTVAVTLLLVAGLGVIFYGGEIGEMLAQRLGVSSVFTYLWRLCKWPLALFFLYLSLEVIFNFAPNRRGAVPRHWGSPGGLVSLLLWLGASLGLRFYISRFHGYATAYGSLGAVILLLVWFYLIGFAILMGGEVNSEIGKALGEGRPKRARPGRRPVKAPARRS
ncbi:MAG TPA: YihY/virulence factor BrkB family protein, partial [Thermoanaerobaculia bacterium]